MRYLACLALCLFSAAAVSQPLDRVPIYDAVKSCRERAGPAFREGCINQEQIHYDYLKAVWTDVDPEVRRRCVKGYEADRLAPYKDLVDCISVLSSTRSARQPAAPFRY